MNSISAALEWFQQRQLRRHKPYRNRRLKMSKLIAVLGLAAAVASPLAIADTAQLELVPGAFDVEKTQYVQNETRRDASPVSDTFWTINSGGVSGY
jgi:hypothetical protein